MNNELTVVQGALYDLEQDPSLATRKDVASRIASSVARAARTIHQLLIFGRRDESAAQDLDLTAEVTRIVDQLRPTITSDIRIDTTGASGCIVRLEPMRLRSVVINLLLNAVDAMPAGGLARVTVRSEARTGAIADAHSVVLSVEDTGEGMSAEVIARACDTFFTTRDRSQHAGIGLSIAAGIVEQRGGRLSIESAPGLGTRVRITWAKPVRASQPQPQRYPLLHPAQLSPLDEPQDEIGACSEELVGNVEQCIDGVMPGRATADVIDVFVARNPRCPVILCSGHLPHELERRRLANARVTLLAKPFSPADLRRALSEALRRASR